tara:strand:- start:25 stop:477 length:453 start_codon:yes stop_codon:yes gene_type:complete
MEAVVLVIHLMLALALIATILVQQSEGGGLGIGGGGGGMGGLATARGTANLLTRTTTILAICFFCTSLGLSLIAKEKSAIDNRSILDIADDAEVYVPLARDEADDIGAPDDEVAKDAEDAPVEPNLSDDDGEVEVQPPVRVEAPTAPISE